jgi:hypothetical protein
MRLPLLALQKCMACLLDRAAEIPQPTIYTVRTASGRQTNTQRNVFRLEVQAP